MGITAHYSFTLTVKEDVGLSMDQVTDPTAVHKISDGAGTLRSTSQVPGTKAWSDLRTLSAGADSLDLTSLPRGSLPAATFDGLKVQLIKIKAAAANTAAIVFAAAGANGYSLFGSAGVCVLTPGAQVQFYWPDNLGDVGSGAKSIAITSTDLDAVYEMILVAG